MLKHRQQTLAILAISCIVAAFPAEAENNTCQKCLLEATQLLSDGDAVKAGELMQTLASQCNDNAQFQTLLSTVLLRLSNMPGAEKAALRAIEIAPKSTAAHFQYALALKGQGKNESAVTEFDKVVELDPGNWESWASLSDLYRQMHLDDKALQCEYKAANLAAPTLDARNSFFKNLIDQKKLAKAEDEFAKAIDTNAKSPIVLQQLAKLALSYNFWNSAVNASQSVLKTYPDSVEALTTKATGEFFQHKYTECQNTLSAIAKISPDNSEAKVLSALCLLDLGQITEAAEILESANAPNSPLSFLAVARWHQARGDLKAAESNFGSISDEMTMPESQLSLSRLYAKQGNLDEATEKATFNATSQTTLSRMLASQAEAICQEQSHAETAIVKARQLANKALSNTPNEPSALLAMSKIEFASGNTEEARNLANKVIEQVPGTADAYLVLAKIELAGNKSPEAEKQLDKVLSLANDDPDASLLLGKLYLQEGNIKKAVDALKAALSTRQESAEICYVLAKALEQDSDLKASLKYYKQSLSLGLVGTDNAEATQAIKRLTGKSQE